MISIVVQCIVIALLMKSIVVQCIGITLLLLSIVEPCNRNNLAKHWNYIAHCCIMHWDCIAYDMHSSAMHLF